MSRVVGAIGLGVLAGGLHALSLHGPAAAAVGSPALPALGSAALPALAWIALVPLVRVAGAGHPSRTVAAALAYALTLGHVDVTTWLAPAIGRYFSLPPPTGTTIGIAVMTVLAAGYGAVLGALLVLRRRVRPALGVVWCAALWCVWETLRNFVPPFLPSCMLALSQVDVTPLFQLASVTGIAGVTALLAAANAAIAERRPRAIAAVAVVALAVAAWGFVRVPAVAAPNVPATTVVLVDGAARTVDDSTLARYVAATPRLDRPPTLVVWPESALDVDFTADRASWKRLAAFVDEIGAPLATGGVGFGLGRGDEPLRYNSVHVVRPRHGLVSYHKRWLVPIAESWPTALGAPPPGLVPVVAGDTTRLFGDGDWRFLPLICFEITDGASARRAAAEGARFVVSVNNDVWFGPEAPHAVWTRVRAVESGLPVARASNRGTSAVVDPYGRYVAVARAPAEPGALVAALPAAVPTAYARTGDWFLPACLLVTVVGLLPRRRGRVASW